MKARWQALLKRFDALTQRERALVAAAVICGILLVGNTIFIEIPLARAKSLSRQILNEQGELATLQIQLAQLQGSMRDPNEENRVLLANLSEQLQSARESLTRYEKLLVAPQDMPALLERLLTRHASLRLLKLNSLPTVQANAALPVAQVIADATAEKAEPVVAQDELAVWKHGVDIEVEGKYAELAAYVADIEKLPQRLMWGEVELKADYPNVRLRLKIYTYSLDQAWLKL